MVHEAGYRLWHPGCQPGFGKPGCHSGGQPLHPHCAGLARIPDLLSSKGLLPAYLHLTPLRPSPAGRSGELSMQLRAFLTALAPVAARQPQVFVEACRATVDLQGAHCLPGGSFVGAWRGTACLQGCSVCS